MRFVTKLLKMNLDLVSVNVERDQLLMRGRSGSLDGEVYLRPKEVIDLVRLGLNAPTIVFVIFFPFYYLVDYLRQNAGDQRQAIFSIGRVASLALAAVLLLGAFPYFARHPLQSAILLAAFAVLFLATFATSQIAALFYAFVILGLSSYYLAASHLGVDGHLYGVLAVPVSIITYFAAKCFDVPERAHLSRLLNNSTYVISLFFGGYVAVGAPFYVSAAPWEAALPLLAFSALYFARYRANRTIRHQYLGLIFLASGYVFLLYALTPLPQAYYGPALGALGILLAIAGGFLRRASSLTHVAPLWVAAVGLPIFGIPYGFFDQTALLISLSLVAVCTYLVSRTAHANKPGTYEPEWWFSAVPFGIANAVALAIAFALFELGSPSFGATASALGLAILYYQIAVDREPFALRSRNVYLHVAAFFLAMFSLLALIALDPFKQIPINASLMLVPLAGVLVLARSIEQKGERSGALQKATSLYEGSYLVMTAALAWPILSGGHSVPVSSFVAIGFLVLYFGFMSFSRNEGLLYSPVIVGAYLYYNVLTGVSAPAPLVSAAYAGLGLVAMVVALTFARPQRPPGKMLYFTWFLFTGLSILPVARDAMLADFALTLCAVSYLVGARFIPEAAGGRPFHRNPTGGLRNLTELMGTVAALASLLLLLVHQSLSGAVVVTAALAVAYVVAFLRSRDHVYLYPGSILLSSAYLLSLKPIATYDNGLLFMLPLLLPLYGLGHYLWAKQQGHLAVPLMLAGHLAALAAIGLVVYYQNLVTMPALVVVSLLLYAAIALALARTEREPWQLLPALIFPAFALYFATTGIGALETRLAALAPLGIVYAGLAGLVRKKIDAWLARPIFTAAVLVALAVSAATFISGGTQEAQLATVASAAAYVLVHILLARHEFVYLVVLSLGLLAYHLLLASVDSFSRDLIQYFAVGLILCGVIFLVPPALQAVGYRKPIWTLLVDNQGWAFVLSLPIFIAVPLVIAQYTVTASANPTFCAGCHSMKSYYETWQKSGHVQKASPPVACDTCHYPPGGPEVLLTGRVTGLMMTVGEMAGLQPSKFHGRVLDANCLQPGCHTKEKLTNWLVFKGVKFNHSTMIDQRVRDIDLNCTSCHARIKENAERHFEVSETVCYYCHLMGRTNERGTAVGTCATCHDAAVETRATSQFFTLGGTAAGAVERSRCLSCHATTSQADDANLMHDAHVTRMKVFGGRKVECFECHSEVRHGNLPGSRK
ncbi:MAG: NapC/NirT family cytochrome c [Chloroflexi bacterium]|nr:NapC/NirT family cytochrome c [Chloroflexota bacterium]